MVTEQHFGGNWTEDKLIRVNKYLSAYTIALKAQPFELFYIDAFAGTGYRSLEKKSKNKNTTNEANLEFPEFADIETIKFLEGSARKALQVVPKFDKYIFIEKAKGYFRELEKIKADFPECEKDITVIHSDANTAVRNFCSNLASYQRAVMFLDPYGMQVPWDTIEIIAETKKIDLWYLFPLGMGVNRLLKKDSNKIDELEKQKLDELFGTTNWTDAFYKTVTTTGLFGSEERIEKGSFFDISQYFVKRLDTIFAGVAPNPLILRNSKNSPLYLLCFAASNEKGAKIAVKIAKNILGK